ncbi:hypothetical protein [Alicyclobacillus ferrooxydans]|uniref:Uncharacterized protein n=1 Tax=Alicyclobacillus ferrooxydans TaxID=471514 RepID=A0A0P9CNG9_9BACL|nr:hypothetical protein [Alicyclobacillus ferrooxydans]KPV44434.1 hypothetical protein AN477_07420 [Alicyclobacillus ferrooxydans]
MDRGIQGEESRSSESNIRGNFGGFASNTGITMDMGDVQFAELSEGTLNQIRKLEHTLRKETQRHIYLLAYEKPSDSPIPHH